MGVGSLSAHAIWSTSNVANKPNSSVAIPYGVARPQHSEPPAWLIAHRMYCHYRGVLGGIIIGRKILILAGDRLRLRFV